MSDDHPLSTKDLARASDETRGRSEETMVNRDAVAAPTAPVATPPSAPKPQAAPQKTDNIAAATSKDRMVPRSDDRAPLFAEQDAASLRQRWSDVQAGFVDEPRRAVEQADSLVADVMKRLAEGFANERASLERQWDRGDNVTTEDLRIALQRYRSFFDRLLSV